MLRRSKAEIIKDTAVTIGVLAASTVLCLLLKAADNTSAYASMIFILSVFLISRLTNGYAYGIAASAASVIIVNYIFTFPYFELNFTLSGYPIYILSMLTVSIITSTMTSQNKQQEEVRIESEREKTRSNLLRAISHDLRTPLTAIDGVCTVMIENDSMIDADERIKLLSEIKHDSQWLIRMVENLLSVTRIDGSTSGIMKNDEAVEEVIADSAAKFKKQFPDRKLTVTIPEEFVMIPMDVILIGQVLTNLLENAAIHAGENAEINLSAKVKSDCVEFAVSDNGCGIPSVMLPHIFDGYIGRDSKNDISSKRNMGIGLSVCNTIIKAHGGTMSAENLKGGGACFKFTLPAEDERKEDKNG